MNEKNDNASCLNEEPLITADQVFVFKIKQQIVCVQLLIMRKKKQSVT